MFGKKLEQRLVKILFDGFFLLTWNFLSSSNTLCCYKTHNFGHFHQLNDWVVFIVSLSLSPLATLPNTPPPSQPGLPLILLHTRNKSLLLMVNLCTCLLAVLYDNSITPLSDAAIRQAKWDASKVREKLRRDIDTEASSVLSVKLSVIIADHEVIFLAKTVLHNCFLS